MTVTFTFIANRQFSVSTEKWSKVNTFSFITVQVRFPVLFQQVRNHNFKEKLNKTL